MLSEWLLKISHLFLLSFKIRFSFDPHKTEILVGTNQWRTDEGQRYKVKRAFLHKDFGRQELGPHAGDIALAQIQNFIEFNQKVQPIKCSRKDVPNSAALQVFEWKPLIVSRRVFCTPSQNL